MRKMRRMRMRKSKVLYTKNGVFISNIKICLKNFSPTSSTSSYLKKNIGGQVLPNHRPHLAAFLRVWAWLWLVLLLLLLLPVLEAGLSSWQVAAHLLNHPAT